MLAGVFGIAAQASPSDSLDSHFTFLYQALKENFDQYSSYIFSTTSALLLMIGWFMTSKDARTYIAKHSRAKVFILAGIIFFVGAEIYFSWGIKCQSDRIVTLLQNTASVRADHIIEAYYQSKVVPQEAVIVFIAAHCILFAILAAIIWPGSDTARGPGSKP